MVQARAHFTEHSVRSPVSGDKTMIDMDSENMAAHDTQERKSSRDYGDTEQDLSDDANGNRGEEQSATSHQQRFVNPFETLEDFHLAPPSAEGVWGTWLGIALMAFGVISPSMLLLSAGFACSDRIALLILKHPIETLLECALVVMVPLANYLTWAALCRKDMRSFKRVGIINGMAVGTSFTIAMIASAAVILHYPAIDENTGLPHYGVFTTIAAVSWGACLVAGFLADALRRTREIRKSRMTAMLYAVFGVMISIVTFAASEAQSICLRIAEHMAISESPGEREQGLSVLRTWNPERDLNMECADARSAGIPGLFLRIDPITQRKLYFAVTGKPYRDDKSTNFSSMPDDYLRKHVVGAPVDGLSLKFLGIAGSVNPETLSSTQYWTFVFKNKTYNNQEARAEIGLPEGAVISGMTMWTEEGETKDSTFNLSGPVAKSTERSVVAGHDAPAVITDLGRGRTLLHCYPVPHQGELRLRMAVSVPLKLHNLSEASLTLPRFIDTNFEVSNNKNSLMLRSPQELSLKGATVKPSPDNEQVLKVALKEKDLSGPGVSINVRRSGTVGPVAVKDPYASEETYLIQTIQSVKAFVPNHLVVVLDCSSSVKEHLNDIKSALQSLPPVIPVSIVLASDQTDDPELLAPKEAFAQVGKINLAGGRDNLQAVVKAAEEAGQNQRGAVLWIHGPQPSFNKELYVMAPYAHTPHFYELAIDNGVMDANEFFRHHREIGPFSAIVRNSSVREDLGRFIGRWHGGSDYIVRYARANKKPGCKMGTDVQAMELAGFWSKEESARLLQCGDALNAAKIAVVHRIVTPLSLSSILSGGNLEVAKAGLQHVPVTQGNGDSYVATATATPGASPAEIADTQNMTRTQTFQEMDSNAPVLQGATNGTIGPQGADATFITGVNTAGVVRVNNLANLEAMLNLFANMVEILGCAVGTAFILRSFLRESTERTGWDSPLGRFLFGLICLSGGLITPGMTNWLVASARDANLFS